MSGHVSRSSNDTSFFEAKSAINALKTSTNVSESDVRIACIQTVQHSLGEIAIESPFIQPLLELMLGEFDAQIWFVNIFGLHIRLHFITIKQIVNFSVCAQIEIYMLHVHRFFTMPRSPTPAPSRQQQQTLHKITADTQVFCVVVARTITTS